MKNGSRVNTILSKIMELERVESAEIKSVLGDTVVVKIINPLCIYDWYKVKGGNAHYFILDGGGHYFGFNIKGEFVPPTSGINILGPNDPSLEPADYDYVQKLLEKEAEKRGFVKGCRFKGCAGIDREEETVLGSDIRFRVKPNNMESKNTGIYYGNSWICLNGVWGEVTGFKEPWKDKAGGSKFVKEIKSGGIYKQGELIFRYKGIGDKNLELYSLLSQGGVMYTGGSALSLVKDTGGFEMPTDDEKLLYATKEICSGFIFEG